MMTHERRHSSYQLIALVLGRVLHHLNGVTECFVVGNQCQLVVLRRKEAMNLLENVVLGVG